MRGGTAAHLARRGERAGWASLHSRQLDREMLRQFDRARSRGRCDAADGRLWLLQGVSDGTASARQLGLGHCWRRDRKSVVEGKSVSVRVALGGRRIITKKK